MIKNKKKAFLTQKCPFFRLKTLLNNYDSKITNHYKWSWRDSNPRPEKITIGSSTCLVEL